MTTRSTTQPEDRGEPLVETLPVQNNSETSLDTRSREPGRDTIRQSRTEECANISASNDQTVASQETMKTSSNEWIVLYEGGTPDHPIRVRIFKEPGT